MASATVAKAHKAGPASTASSTVFLFLDLNCTPCLVLQSYDPLKTGITNVMTVVIKECCYRLPSNDNTTSDVTAPVTLGTARSTC